jgi:TusA-related sulfurtransferase
MSDVTQHIQLDVRGLAAPEPMVKILETTASLPTGTILTVLHSRIPALLYPRLAERGLSVETVERSDGVVQLTIQRPVI